MRADVMQSALVSTRAQIVHDLETRSGRDVDVVNQLTTRLERIIASLARAEITTAEAWTRFGDIQSDIAELDSTETPSRAPSRATLST